MSEYVETDLDNLNSLTGGLPKGSLLGIYGQATSGKTILTTQAAWNTMKTRDGNALIIDTEGSLPTHREWAERFNDRYDLDVSVDTVIANTGSGQPSLKAEQDSDGSSLYVVALSDIQDILALHGREAKITASGNKMDLERGGSWSADPAESPIAEWCQAHDVVFTAYDSVTMPLTIFGSGQQNFPARSMATQWWMLTAQFLAQRLDLVSVCTMHRTASPSGFDRAQATGGKAVLHNLKTLLYLEHKSDNDKHSPSPPTKFPRDNDHGRYVWLARHPSRPEWERCVLLNIGSEGFEDYER